MAESIPYLTAQTVRRLINPRDLLKAISKALRSFSRHDGTVVQPVRITVPVEKHGGFLAAMPALSYDAEGGLGVKIVTWNPHNKSPAETHYATVLMFDAATGAPRAIMDGGVLTAARTAAVSAVAVDALAVPRPRVLGVLGAGTQARSHIEYLSLVRDFAELRVWSRTLASAQQCIADMQPLFPSTHMLAVATAEEAVRGADVVVTATSATTPVLCGEWLQQDAVVVAVGACRPDMRELDDAAMRGAMVVVDSEAGAHAESGDVILSKATVHAELGALLAGTAPPRQPRQRWAVFKSLGMAVEDVAAAQMVLQQYAAAGRHGKAE